MCRTLADWLISILVFTAKTEFNTIVIKRNFVLQITRNTMAIVKKNVFSL